MNANVSAWFVKTARLSACFCWMTGSVFASDLPIVWRLPGTESIVWQGMLPNEGGAVQMGQQIGLYPVGNAGLAGLIVAVATHAAISQMQQSEEKKRAQKAADLALSPFQPALGEWKMAELRAAVVLAARQANLTLLGDDQSPAGTGIFIETVPLFSMSLDHAVLVLDAQIRVGRLGEKIPEKEVMIRVISTPLDIADPRAYWAKDESQMIKRAASEMMKHVLQLSTSTSIWVAPQETSVKTFRYLQGTTQRIERAEELQSDCARLILRNLRQSIMSVPRKVDPEQPCKQTYPF